MSDLEQPKQAGDMMQKPSGVQSSLPPSDSLAAKLHIAPNMSMQEIEQAAHIAAQMTEHTGQTDPLARKLSMTGQAQIAMVPQVQRGSRVYHTKRDVEGVVVQMGPKAGRAVMRANGKNTDVSVANLVVL